MKLGKERLFLGSSLKSTAIGTADSSVLAIGGHMKAAEYARPVILFYPMYVSLCNKVTVKRKLDFRRQLNHVGKAKLDKIITKRADRRQQHFLDSKE